MCKTGCPVLVRDMPLAKSGGVEMIDGVVRARRRRPRRPESTQANVDAHQHAAASGVVLHFTNWWVAVAKCFRRGKRPL